VKAMTGLSLPTSSFGIARRTLLQASCSVFAASLLPRVASAAGARDPRFVVIILRGALDGLSTVAPVGDPDYADLHGKIALSLIGDHAAKPLDSMFALHPSMPVFAQLYADRQAMVIHAVATGYRERSHFDGQDVLESGMPLPGFVQSGWLNRAVSALPQTRVAAPLGGLAIGPATPLVLRGAAPVVGWAPQTLPGAEDELAMRLLDLYRHTDPMLAKAMSEGLDIDKIASREMGDTKPKGGPESVPGMRQAAQGCAKLMAAPDGPRIAALSFNGWDTHANEGGPTGRLAQLLEGLDGAFDEFKTGLGPIWNETTIIAVTEFGRTVKVNGTVGTDHGTGTVALLAGGAVKGGRVLADWPGLAADKLYEKRDLRPTMDLRAVVKGLLAEQFDLSPKVLGASVFPETASLMPVRGLVI